jgi:ribosome maturation factor RimP
MESRNHLGTLVAADEQAVTLSTDAGDRVVLFEDIASARTVFEWGDAR